MSTACYQIVLADDHVRLRQELKIMLEEDTDIRVIGEAGDGLELVDLLKRARPQMVILDLSMPHMDGYDAVRQIKAKYPDITILILTMHKDEEYVIKAASSGVSGYVVKENADTELFQAIRSIRAGYVYFPPC